MSARKVVADVLGPAVTREIWTFDYRHVLPISLQIFDLSAVLPAVFYMFRFGRRRGKGRFLDVFGRAGGTPAQRRASVTVDAITSKLAGDDNGGFRGFRGDAAKAILGDLLLCYCLDNKKYAIGRDKQVQRVAPAHYMSSWIDLPEELVHLRYVPETIVALLADQSGDTNVRRTHPDLRNGASFPVGGAIEQNVLLRPFAGGVQSRARVDLDNYSVDQFLEDEESVGIDQLLMIRLAQSLGSAPKSQRTRPSIPNRRSVAVDSSRRFSADLHNYLRAYAGSTPRQVLVETLDCCLAVGLTSMISSIVPIMEEWSRAGNVDGSKEPCDLLVDCSAGADGKLRAMAERSMDDYMRRASRILVHFMALRLLDHGVRSNARMNDEFGADELKGDSNATEWLTLLGGILHGRVEGAPIVTSLFEYHSGTLARVLGDEYPEVGAMLTDYKAFPNPVLRLAEGLVALQGSRARKGLNELVDSALMTDRPNGLARKRRAQRAVAGRRKSVVLRSAIFSDTALEYLVHLLLLKPGDEIASREWLSLDEFIATIRERYGFCIDRSPAGMHVSNELLQRNRAFLDRRLRDLGLLVSVNDAEAMKRLTPRFELSEGR